MQTTAKDLSKCLFSVKKENNFRKIYPYLCYFDYFLYIISSKISGSNSKLVYVISEMSGTYSDCMKNYNSKFSIFNIFHSKYIFLVNFDHSNCTDILKPKGTA